MTSNEFSLLDAFVENTGHALSRDHLSTVALGRHCHAGDRGIDNLVARLRCKLRDSPRLGRVIRTTRLIGYVFTGFGIVVTTADLSPTNAPSGEHQYAAEPAIELKRM